MTQNMEFKPIKSNETQPWRTYLLPQNFSDNDSFLGDDYLTVIRHKKKAKMRVYRFLVAGRGYGNKVYHICLWVVLLLFRDFTHGEEGTEGMKHFRKAQTTTLILNL